MKTRQFRLSEVALLSGDTMTHQTAYEHLDEARTSALIEIVIPEAEAQLARGAELTAHALLEENSPVTVSYTHLDVYKRQP